MDSAIDTVLTALDAAPNSEEFHRGLQSALGRAAAREGLRGAWVPSSRDPRLLRRLTGAVADLTLDPEDPTTRSAIGDFIETECSTAALALVRAVQQSPSDNVVVSAWIEYESPRVSSWCALFLSRNSWLRRGGLSSDEVVRDLLQDAWLHLLEREGRVLRAFRGDTLGEWRVFLRTSVLRHLGGLRRAARSESRRPPGGFVRQEDVRSEPRCVEPDAEWRLELNEALAALEELRSSTTSGERNAGWLERLALGETVSEIARGEQDIGRTGVSAAVSRFRSLLGSRMGRKDKGGGE